jgi:hypothetical protein
MESLTSKMLSGIILPGILLVKMFPCKLQEGPWNRKLSAFPAGKDAEDGRYDRRAFEAGNRDGNENFHYPSISTFMARGLSKDPMQEL